MRRVRGMRRMRWMRGMRWMRTAGNSTPQCLSPTPNYTEDIHENLKIFDKLFSEFEFSYVSCMVHVKTVKEYEIQQDVICLFSDTLQRAINNQMITQDMVDFYDPSLMFAIPRLAIVCGLVIFPTGPLNVERETADFPELFRPFKNLLRKIRDLLLTLTPGELFVLERLLCQLEEPTDLEKKLQAAQQELESSAEVAGRAHQAARLDAKLLEVEEEDVDVGSKIVGDILADLLASVVGEDKASSCERDTQEKDAEKEELNGEQRREERRRERKEAVPVAVVEIDCTSPDITVRREGKRGGGEDGEEKSEECSSCTVEGGEEGRRSSSSLRTGEESRSGKRSSLRRRGGKRTVRSGKD